MNRSLDFWSHNRHPCYDSLNWDILVDEVCLKTTGCNMILTKVAFKVDVVLLDFRRECFVVLESGFLIVALLVTGIVLDNTFELWLEHVDGFDWVLGDISGEVRTELTEIVEVDIEARVLLWDETLNRLLLGVFAHELRSCDLHRFLVECLGFNLVVSCVDLHKSEDLPP